MCSKPSPSPSPPPLCFYTLRSTGGHGPHVLPLATPVFSTAQMIQECIELSS